jgi:hypothetical protein
MLLDHATKPNAFCDLPGPGVHTWIGHYLLQRIRQERKLYILDDRPTS